MTGIYAIVNLVSGCRYIGRSTNCERRWKEHRAALERGRHYNEALQRDWTNQGSSTFSFEILEEQPDFAACKARELWFMRHSDATYNMPVLVNSQLHDRRQP